MFWKDEQSFSEQLQNQGPNWRVGIGQPCLLELVHSCGTLSLSLSLSLFPRPPPFFAVLLLDPSVWKSEAEFLVMKRAAALTYIAVRVSVDNPMVV